MAGAGSDASCWYAKHRPWRLWASRDGVDATTWPERWPRKIAPWSGRVAVLVTTLDGMAFPVETIARLYRERADAENIYDELKNQWGWNGFTTRKLAPCRLMAQPGGAGLRLVASVCAASTMPSITAK